MNYSTHLEKLSNLFMDVGRSIPRYERIALLYPRSTKLQSYLIEYYIVVVGLCRYLYSFGQKSTVQWFASSLNMSYLNSVRAELGQWANSIKDQMTVSEAEESSGFRALTKGLLQSASRQQIRATNLRVLDFCSTYDHETAWKQLRRVGNASIFRQQPEYREWRDSSHPSTLLYRGKLGSGKSVLLANIVDDLSLRTKGEEFIVVYFFCRHDVPESLQARTIVGSLARQLLHTVADLSVTAKSCETAYSTGNTEKVLEVLLQGFSSKARVFLVLDGLDECDVEEKETLMQALQKVQEKTNTSVCVSLRGEPNNSLRSITKQLLDTRIVSMPVDNPDIAAFIEADLERCLQQERLTIGDSTLILKIQDTLLEGSQGMFLWVALQIQSLCTMNSDHAIREALSDLPKDLSETYARILYKSGLSDPELQAKTLQLVLAARRPLTTDELLEALSVIPGDASWDPSRALNSIYSALGCCGCLLVTDEEEFTVRIVHRSVKQYLIGLDSGEHTKFSKQEANKVLADIVVTYLSYGVFGTELSRSKVQPMGTRSAPTMIMQATLGSSNALAIKLLKKRRQPEFDMSRVIAEARGASAYKPQPVFKFYTYARRYWQDHVLHVSGHDDNIVKLSSKLIHDRKSELKEVVRYNWTPFQRAVENGNECIVSLLVRAGNINPRWGGGTRSTPLLWASENAYNDTVKALLSIGGVNVEAKDNQERTPLIQAARKGHKDTVEILLSNGEADVEAEDRDGWASLIAAASNGHKEVVEVLLSVGKANVEAKTKIKRTALMLAASNGHTNVVDTLISLGADVEAKDHFGWTPLMMAADKGQRDTADVLLKVGRAYVEATDNNGSTPLMHAARNGHEDTVGLLLRAANIETTDQKGWWPLIAAASNGHKETVEVLLGKAQVERKTSTGATPLIEATRNGHTETVGVLLKVGKANPEAEDVYGWTPLMYAERNKDKKTAKVLRSYISQA